MSGFGGRGRARLAAAGTVALVVSACAGGSAGAPACPRAAILADAQSMTRFAPGRGRSAGDVDFAAEITDLASGCRIERRRDGRDVLVVAVAPVITTSQGPANTSGRANFFYFVSLISPERTIVSRESFASEARFSADERRVVRREDDPPVTIDIPLGPQVAAADHQIIVGLQLAPDELEYNRRRQGPAR